MNKRKQSFISGLMVFVLFFSLFSGSTGAYVQPIDDIDEIDVRSDVYGGSDYSDFELQVDEIEITSDSVTINWSTNSEHVTKFELYLDGEKVVDLPKDKNSYTFTGLTTGERYEIKIVTYLEGYSYGYNNHYEWVIPSWSEDELVPVSLMTIFNEDPEYYEDRMRVRGLGESNKSFKVDEYIGNTGDLHLPIGKYDVTIYNENDPSIAIVETFTIDEGVDYIKNPIQLKFRLKEARKAAEPFEFDVKEVTENSFTLSWNEVSKITGFEIIATNRDGSYHSSESGLLENNMTEYTLENLNENLTYSVNFFTNYLHDLKHQYYFNIKTAGEDDKGDKVAFKDSTLKDLVAKDLGIYLRDVTKVDMKYLDGFFSSYKGIESLQGIEYAQNLKDLYVYGNKISDLGPLSGLTKLESLDLDSNYINDISALKNLTNLTSLDLNWNNISNIESLTNLSALTWLTLYNNSLVDISTLKDLTDLTYLDLGSNNISDISALKGLTELINLNAGNNEIEEIDSLKSLLSLSSLELYRNNITDISALKDLTNLTDLSLNSNDITNISALRDLTNLNHLYLSSNNLTDISALKTLTNLNYLDLDWNDITDISALKNLTNLNTLYLYNNNLTDIPVLKGLTNLERLDLGSNNITDISALKDLTNLTYLDLNYNNLTDISVLKELPRLQELSIYGIEKTDENVEVIEYLIKDGVEVDYDFEDDWEDDWEDEDEIIIDREEVLEKFPADKGFIVSGDGKTITVDLSKDNVELTTEQMEILIKNNQRLDVKNDGVHTSIPSSIFNGNAEPITFEAKEEKSDPNSLSGTYDFTIKQGNQTISKFDEGIALTFTVNTERVKNPKNLKVFYFNEETQEWENVGGTYNSNGTVTVVTTHFSKFTVFEAADEDSDEIIDIDSGNEKPIEPEENPGSGGGINPNPDTDQNAGKDEETEKDEIPAPEKNDKQEKDHKTEEANITNVNNGTNNETSGSAEGNKLPDTATNLFNYLMIGGVLLLAGASALVFKKKKSVNA